MRHDEDRVDDAALALLYLTMHRRGRVTRAWKGLAREVLDRLHEKGLIGDPKSKAKSVVVHEEGVERSEELFRRLFVDGEEATYVNSGTPRLLERLDPNVARRILLSLHRRGGEAARLVEQELERCCGPEGVEAVARAVFDDLESLETDDLWNRSGGRAGGRYVEPAEAAFAMVREAVAPHLARLEDLLERGREEDADLHVRGVLLGLHRYDRASEREFRRWAVDAPEMMADEAADRWREGRPDRAARRDLSAWMSERLTEWTGGR